MAKLRVHKLSKFLKYNGLWVFYFVFTVWAISTHDSEPVFSVAGPLGYGKALTWVILIGFLAYSLYCHIRESFFHSMRDLMPYFWFKQIGFDLYLGLLIPLALIYLSEGSLVTVGIWFLPLFFMANLATLLYLALNYQSLIAHFY